MAAIFRAVPGDSRRCRGQPEYQRAGFDLIDAQPWCENRKQHYKAILRRLALHMDWHDRTTRPTHEVLRGPHRPGCPGPHKPGCHRPLAGCECGERCGCPGRVSSDTVGRAVAWFGEAGLLGTVSPGVRADMRSWMHAAEGNLAAVYVCTVPKRRSRTRCRVAGQGEFADLTTPRSGVVEAPRARPAEKTQNSKARAPRGLTMLPCGGSPLLHRCPENRTEGLAAAEAVRERARDLRRLSAEHVRYLGRVFFASGWTPADVVHAIDHDPGGRQHGYGPWGTMERSLAVTGWA
jgi:hypothetical protein